MSNELQGGCFCGNVRYKICGEPVIQLFCYCNDCQSMTGSDGWAGYMVNESDFTVIAGQAKVHEKTSKEGRVVRQCFCDVCGSNLWGETEFGLVSVAAGSLDDPSVFKPTKKVFVADAPHWARIPAELEEM